MFIFGCAVSLLLHGLFSSCRNQGLLFAAGHRLLMWWLRLSRSTGSRVWGLQELRLVGSVVVGPGLQSTGSAAVVHTGLVAPWWVESSHLRDGTHISCTGGGILYHWATREAHQYNYPLHLLSLWVWKKNHTNTWPISPMCVSLFWSWERVWQPKERPFIRQLTQVEYKGRYQFGHSVVSDSLHMQADSLEYKSIPTERKEGREGRRERWSERLSPPPAQSPGVSPAEERVLEKITWKSRILPSKGGIYHSGWKVKDSGCLSRFKF